MNNLELKSAFLGSDGIIYGIDDNGNLWYFRQKEYRKLKDDNFDGEIGDLIYPTGWYPETMRKIESVRDYKEAGVKKY